MTYAAPQSSPALHRLPVWAVLLATLVVGAAPAVGAQARINQSTTFRKAPGGATLAELQAGAAVAAGARQGDWTAVTLEGWVFSRSLDATTREGFDLVVTPANGENLRAAPNGAVRARLENGLLLEKVGTQGGWTRVRRAGWVSTQALAGRNAPPKAAAGASRDSTPAGQADAGDAGEDRVQALRATVLELTPDGDSLAILRPGASGQVIGRNGEWVQVQVQGWVREADLSEPASAALPGVTVAQVRADPSKYVGQLLDWTVQFIAVQTADELRPEIPAGARYLLTRGPLPEPGFVYVIVTPQQVPTFEAASPLQQFTLRGRLRAASTRYMPTPVLELVQVLGTEGGTP